MDIFDFRVKPKTALFFKDHVPEPIEAFKPYYARYGYDPEGDVRMQLRDTLEESTKELKECGVTKAMICATCAEDNVHTYEAMQKYPGFYYGMATVHTSQGVKQAYKALEIAYDEYNMSGFGINPYLEDIYATDPKYYPLYAMSEEKGKFVHIHSSFHYNPTTKMDLGNPEYIDQIAIDFPELKIIIAHAGRGFGLHAAWIADRHPNVFMDFTALHPKYVDFILLQMANTMLRKKVIYGSSNPLFHWDMWKLWQKYMKSENHQLFLHDNVLRVLGEIKDPVRKWNEKRDK